MMIIIIITIGISLPLIFSGSTPNNISTTMYKFSNDRNLQVSNDIFKLRENMYNLQNLRIFQEENFS